MNTFADFIRSANDGHLYRDTAWLVKFLARRIPCDAAALKLETSTFDEPVPEFRKNSPHGLIKIGDLTIGAANGMGYLNGKKGPWSEMREAIVAAVLNGDMPAGKPIAKYTPKKTKSTKAPKKEVARPAKVKTSASGDYLVCECCGRHVGYEEGLVRLGGKRICGKCAKARTAKVNVPNPDADLSTVDSIGRLR